MPRFDVLTEPWIPARARDGEVREYGLLDVLAQAHELTDLIDPAPPIQYGLYRLLIGFITDALQIQEREDLEALLRHEQFDPAILERYVDLVGRERFDLFDAGRPFLQAEPMAEDAEHEKSVAELFFHLPSGSFVTHYNHRTADQHAIHPAVCARALAAVPAFMTAGGQGYSPTINGTPPWYLLIRGDSLHDTLLLNCLPTGETELDGEEPAAWRSRQPVVPRQERNCSTLLEGLTWRPRRIRLIPSEGGSCTYTGKESPGLIRRMVYWQGFKYGASDAWTDPHVAYVTTEKGRFPLRPQEDRELWRDTGPLLLLRREDYHSSDGRRQFDRPVVVTQFRNLRMGRPRAQQEVVEVYGMRADKAKVFEWRYERLSLPAAVATNPHAGAQLQEAMELAERVADSLRYALKKAYPRDGEGNNKALDRLIQSAHAVYWSTLRVRFEETLLQALETQDPNDLAARQSLSHAWEEVLRAVGRAALEQAIESLGTGARALERQVGARSSFHRSIAWLFKSPAEREASKGRKAKR